jgi:hypothetical protein
VRIRPEHPYGSRKPLYWWLLTSRRWTPPRPVNVYVIEHASGLILFDTGQDRASVTDETYFPGGATGYLYADSPASAATGARSGSWKPSARPRTQPRSSSPPGPAGRPTSEA